MNAGPFIIIAFLIVTLVLCLIPGVRRVIAAGLRFILHICYRLLTATLSALSHSLWKEERSGCAKLNPPKQRYRR